MLPDQYSEAGFTCRYHNLHLNIEDTVTSCLTLPIPQLSHEADRNT